MASTRSNAKTHPAARSTAGETPKQALLTLFRRGAHIEIAAFMTAATTLTGWAQSADRLAQAVGDELLHRINGETGSAELAARVAAAGSTHLRELSALSRAATNHFDTRLARVPIDK